MQNYVKVSVPQDLLPQVTRELLSFTTDPNRVEVVHGPQGQELHVDPLVAEAWLEYRKEKEAADLAALQPEAPAPAPEPEPAPPPAPEPAPAPEPEPTPPPAPTPAPVAVPAPAPVTPPPAPRPTTKGK